MIYNTYMKFKLRTLIMGKLSFLFRRLRYMHYDKFFDTAKQISKKTGRKKASILVDMAGCAIRYGAGYVDYRIAEMYRLSAAQTVACRR